MLSNAFFLKVKRAAKSALLPAAATRLSLLATLVDPPLAISSQGLVPNINNVLIVGDVGVQIQKLMDGTQLLVKRLGDF